MEKFIIELIIMAPPLLLALTFHEKTDMPWESYR